MELKIHSTTHFNALTPAIVKAILAPVILFVVVYLRERPLAISPVYLSVATLALVSIRFFIDLKKVRYRPVQIQLKDHMFSME
jgi:hypothetical protein